MGQLLVNLRQVVLPGEMLAEGMDYLPSYGAFREGDKVIASQVGLANISGRLVSVIPLSGRYTPRRGDTVVGYINDIAYTNWFVDIGYAYEATLSLKEATSSFVERGASISEILSYNQVILAKVLNVTKEKLIDLTMRGLGLRKLTGGNVIEVVPSKIPRIIGKQGSMVSMIKRYTGCNIFAGQNGRVWIGSGTPENEKIAADAIKMIEEKSHMSGLTEHVEQFLKNNVKSMPSEEKNEASRL
ncbi:RNA-binding protein [archaeon]|nr:RNA-binding protein [archaeon]